MAEETPEAKKKRIKERNRVDAELESKKAQQRTPAKAPAKSTAAHDEPNAIKRLAKFFVPNYDF